MKAVLSLTRLYFSVYPIQRWLPWISVGLLAAFVVVLVIRSGVSDYQDMAAGASVMLAIVIAVSLFPALFTAGVLFRYLSAPPSYRLLPHFRPKMLLSLGVWFLILFFLPASVAVFVVTTEGIVSPIVPLATIFAFISGTFYFCFRLMAPSPRTFLEIVAFLILLQLLAHFEERSPIMNQVTVFAAILMAIAWVVFVVWYLRASTVSPVVRSWDNSLWKGRAFRIWESRLPDSIPRDLAVTAILRGRPSRSLTKNSLLSEGTFGLMILGATFIGTGYFVGAVVSHDDVILPIPIDFAIAIGGGLGMVIGVNQMASRARILWLLCGGERLALFRVLEIEALKLAAVSVVFVTLLFTGMQLAGISIGIQHGLLVLGVCAAEAAQRERMSDNSGHEHELRCLRPGSGSVAALFIAGMATGRTSGLFHQRHGRCT